jgi:hypothetical protein
VSKPCSLVLLAAGIGLLCLPAAAQSLPAPFLAPSQHALDGAHGGALQPADDIELGGRIAVGQVRIPAGVTVWVVEDLELVSAGDIVIDGALVARPATAGAAERDGASITLRSAGVIFVNGELRAGDGADGVHPGQAGGHGGGLLLQAAAIVSARDLVGGHGGHGGSGAAGGDGGDALAYGDVVPPVDATGLEITLRAGDGGHGGPGLAGGLVGGAGGAGGTGGSAAAGPADADGTPGVPGNPGTHQTQSIPGADGAAGGPCSSGLNGFGGANAVGGMGGSGGPGGAATSPGGNGGIGGAGADGGSAVASEGGRGGDAGGCCFLPAFGSQGGIGGRGGVATSGAGGHGGFGGAGGSFGTGGDGGAAGDSGNATGGASGDGGRGGDGSPAGIGGGPGLLGLASAGAMGLGGLAGNGGAGPGVPGADGVKGTATLGALGAQGTAGTFCLTAATWIDTGFSLAPVGGSAPKLLGLGSLLPGTLNSLVVFEARPFAPAVTFLSLEVLAVKFKGGWLIPAPDLALFLVTDPNGQVSMPFVMSNAPVPSVVLAYVQIWVQDPEGPQGFTASNSLRARIP